MTGVATDFKAFSTLWSLLSTLSIYVFGGPFFGVFTNIHSMFPFKHRAQGCLPSHLTYYIK